ncbi:unannotated protein [freshwater metagenome]|uniref:Unannotated protein n=1 Tax=freshwater metagenome TaxID=449393 RepID=A0A6J6ZW61_9ZZZZ
MGEQERGTPHDGEVDREGEGYPRDIEWVVGDAVALHRKEKHDGEEQPVQRNRADAGQVTALVPLDTLDALSEPAAQVAEYQWDAEEDEHRTGDVPGGDVNAGGVEAEPIGQHREIEPAVHGEQQDLDQCVDRHKHRCRFAVAEREVVPDQHHRDARGDTDDYEAGSQPGLVVEEQPREAEHEQRADDPVEEQREPVHPAAAPVGPHLPVAHLREHRVHHEQQTDRDRQRDRVHLHAVQLAVEIREDRPEREPRAHCQPDPQGEEAVEGRQTSDNVGGLWRDPGAEVHVLPSVVTSRRAT